MPVKHVNSDYAFDSEMGKAGSKPVCVDFFAEWCGPCKQIAPFFEQLSAKYPGVVFLKVDVDQCTNAAASNGVQAMPTFMMFVNRTKKDMVRGADSSSLENMVRKYASGGGGGGFGGRGATLAGGMGSSSSGSGAVSAPEPGAGEPSLWHNANDRLRGMGVPQLAAGGFVFEPAALVLAVAALLFYGPFGPLLVLGLTALAQTSASPFDRYAMEITGIEGNYRLTSERVLQVLRSKKDSLVAVLEAFVYDPLINWRLLDVNKRNPGEDQIKKTNMTDFPADVMKEVLDRIKLKISGREFSVEEAMSIEDQVDRLIIEASSHVNLAQCYIGWCPYW